MKTVFLCLLLILSFSYLKAQNESARVINNQLDSADYYWSKDVIKARSFLDYAVHLSEQSQDTVCLITSLTKSGRAYHLDGNSEQARTELYQALKLHSARTSDSTLATIYDNLGLIYRNAGHYAKADSFFNQSQEIHQFNRDTISWANVINNKGCIYRDQSFFDSALVFLDSSLELLSSYPESDIYMETTYLKGDIHYDLHQYDSAYIYLLKNIDLERKKVGHAPAANYAKLAEICLRSDRHEEAQMFLDSAYQFLEKTENNARSLARIYRDFSEYYETALNYPASLEAQKKAYLVREIILKQENQGKISKAESAFEVYKKQQEIQALKTKKELAEARSREFLIILFSTFLILILLSLLALSKHRSQRKIVVQKQVLQKQYEKLELLNQEKSELLAMVSHNLKTPLVGMRYLINSILKNKGPINESEQGEKVGIIQSNVERMIDSTQLLLKHYKIDLRQPIKREMLDANELINNLIQLHREHAKQEHIQIRFKPIPDSSKIQIDELLLYQVIDNLLSNAVKYSSEYSTIRLSASLRFSQFLCFSIANEERNSTHTDTSLMMVQNKSYTQVSSGLGLFLIRKYLNALGGKVWVSRRTPGQTRFSLVVPIAR